MPAALSSTRPSGRPVRHRPWAALALLAGVLWLHALLIGALAPGLPQRAGAGAAAAARPPLQVSLLPRTTAAPAAATPPQTGAAPAAAAPAPSLAPAPAGPAAALPPTARPSARAPARLAGADPAAGPGADAPADGSADPSADPSIGPPGPPETEAPGEPPPVYATRIPPPLQLRYALRYNGRAGDATLAWRHDGRQYTLALDGRSAAQPLVLQSSRGGFDAAGLAPERFTDRRGGSRLQAANFRRDIGRIAFSGPGVDHPAWPGAQDRLSWLPQLVAIRAAAQDSAVVPADIRLFVVDARGGGSLWVFQPDGDERLDTPLGPLATQRWRREPPRPEGLRVEAWLDAARGHWPAALRFTALRSGDVFELRLLDEPAPPP